MTNKIFYQFSTTPFFLDMTYFQFIMKVIQLGSVICYILTFFVDYFVNLLEFIIIKN